MLVDGDNKTVQLCTQGMMQEAEGGNNESASLFQQAWDAASTDFEKFVAAHYLAKQQKTVADKLQWDETALEMALATNDDDIKGAYASLYLNIGKCHEDLQNLDKAAENYDKALSHVGFLEDDGYGRMIKAGIVNGIERLNALTTNTAK
jgi:tetratricopeptide (TPR) repeat protein